LAGKSGRKTAKVCEAKAMETAIATAAHFMSRRVIKTRKAGKKNI
jgi:hypothetical protein